jgi:hypothetical protein
VTFQTVVNKVYSTIKNTRGSVDKRLSKIFKTLYQCYKLLNSYLSFFFVEIVERNFKEFAKIFETSVDIFEINERHNVYLSNIVNVVNTKIAKDFEKIYTSFAKLYLKVNLKFKI